MRAFWTGHYRLDDAGTTMRRRFICKQPVPLYDFTNSDEDPLTLHMENGDLVRPFRHFHKMDFGSVPLLCQSIVSPLASPKSFILHDSCYEFHMVWINGAPVSLTQRQADNLLYDGFRADGQSAFTAGKAWLGVRAGGWCAWPKDCITIENENRYQTIMQDAPLKM